MTERIDTIAPYVNARVSGMRSRLYSRGRLDSLLDFNDVSRVVDALLSSPYEQEMAEALTQHQGADAIEEAVSRNLVKTFQKLLSITSDHMRTLTETFLLRWDLMAVKSLLRLRHRNLEPEEVMAELEPGPTLTPPLLRSFAQRKSMEELVNALAVWKPQLCVSLQRVLPQYETDRSVQVLEEALDRAYFVDGISALEAYDDEDTGILRTVLGMEIDRINIRTLFQLKNEDAKSESLTERMLPKGILPARILHAIAAARDAAGAMQVLANTVYRDLAQMLYTFVQSARFSPMERQFELILIYHLRRLSRIHVMSIAVVMHYAWLKYNEVVNLRLIARGEADHLPRGRVREEIMYV